MIIYMIQKRAAEIEECAWKASEERNHTPAEGFPDLVGKEKTLALRAYRKREDLTQRELAEEVVVPQRHISEMENGKRVIGKEMTKRIGTVLGVAYP